MRALLAALAILVVLSGMRPGANGIHAVPESVVAAADASFDDDLLRCCAVATVPVALATPAFTTVGVSTRVHAATPRRSAAAPLPLRL